MQRHIKSRDIARPRSPTGKRGDTIIAHAAKPRPKTIHGGILAKLPKGFEHNVETCGPETFNTKHLFDEHTDESMYITTSRKKDFAQIKAPKTGTIKHTLPAIQNCAPSELGGLLRTPAARTANSCLPTEGGRGAAVASAGSGGGRGAAYLSFLGAPPFSLPFPPPLPSPSSSRSPLRPLSFFMAS